MSYRFLPIDTWYAENSEFLSNRTSQSLTGSRFIQILKLKRLCLCTIGIIYHYLILIGHSNYKSKYQYYN